MIVRPASVGDVEALAGVLVSSWEGAYRGLMPDVVFDTVTFEARVRQWESYFDFRRPRHRLLVAEDSADSLVGMAHLGPTRDDDLDPATTAELFAIYVVPPHWGRGYGRALMEAALAAAAEIGFGGVGLWVLDSNRRGRRFYESGGWSSDGRVKQDESFGVPLREVRYLIDLASPTGQRDRADSIIP